MTEENPPPRTPTAKQTWKEVWFFLSFLAVLFWRIDGLIGALSCFYCMNFLEPRLSRPLAAIVATAVGIAAFVAAQMLLSG